MTDLARPAPAPSVAAAAAPARVPWLAVGVFLLVAYGGGWLLALPLWFTGGLRSPWFTPLGLAVMTTPTIGALVATRFVLRVDHPARHLGLTRVRPWSRTIAYAVLGFVGVQVLGLLAIGVAWVAGVTPVRLVPGAGGSFVSMQLLGVLVAVAALGEEIGWRGFLLPALRPLGTWPALLLSGWLRMRSGTVYPSAFAHGALNATTGTLLAALVPATAGTTPSVLGWAGWLVVAAVIAALALTRTFRWRTTGLKGS